nr:MAG: hypothetical protein [Caudoviricetes sp.]
MTIYLEDFREIVEKLEVDHIESEKYLDSLRKVDSGLSSFICETKYTDILYFQNQFILKKLLGEDLSEWVSWYIYELPLLDKYDTPNCSVNGVEYKVTDLDSFMDFAKHGLLLPMKPREN